MFRIWEFVGKKYLIVDFVLSYFLNSFGTEILQNSVCERKEREGERVSLGGSSESFLLELESFQCFVEFGAPSLFVCLFVELEEVFYEEQEQSFGVEIVKGFG